MRSRRATPSCSAFDPLAAMMTSELPKTSVAETLAEKIVALKAGSLPATTTRKCEDLLIDVVGLCVTARNEDYVASALAGWDDDGPCTVIGHQRTLNAAGVAFVNGTAAHGEDFDDTFEGGPVHAGAVIVPAVLAVSEREKLKGADALAGIAVGAELMCRASLVAPKRIHKAGFHPTAVLGAVGAAAGVATALRLSEEHFVNTLGIVGSMAGGIIEYLAEGSWTKRLDVRDVVEVVCEAAEGTVHRLWEPLAAKQRPPNAYAGKFSSPYCIAAGFVLGHAGLEAFTEERVRDERLRSLAAKVRYEIDPQNPYPDEFTGHVRVRLKDGRELEERQGHLRGGRNEPLSRADIEEKFRLNCAYGGWSAAQAERFLAFARQAFDSPIDLSPFRS